MREQLKKAQMNYITSFVVSTLMLMKNKRDICFPLIADYEIVI